MNNPLKNKIFFRQNLVIWPKTDWLFGVFRLVIRLSEPTKSPALALFCISHLVRWCFIVDVAYLSLLINLPRLLANPEFYLLEVNSLMLSRLISRNDQSVLPVSFWHRQLFSHLFELEHLVDTLGSSLCHPLFKWFSFRRWDRLNHSEHLFQVCDIGQSHFPISSLHFQLVTICHRFISFQTSDFLCLSRCPHQSFVRVRPWMFA